MLKHRILTALVALPLALAAFIYAPKWFIAPLILVCLTLSALEVGMMLFPRFEELLGGRRPLPEKPGKAGVHKAKLRRFYRPAIVSILGWGIFLFSAFATGTYAQGRGILVVGLMAGVMIGCFASKNIDVAAARGFGFIVSIVYGVLPWLVVWDLYLMGEGSRYIFLLMAVVWGGDTGAYFTGRTFGGKLTGGRKLAPSISPKKTWEGALGGILAGVAGACLTNLAYLGNLGSWEFMVFIGVIGSIFGILGDLVESTLKRFARVKDSGRLLPGHGGFLDRVDGILFAAPAIWLILYIFA